MDLVTYFTSEEKRLIDSFNEKRNRLTDSSVKGGANEKLIGEFLSDHLNNRKICYNNQIVDSKGNMSDELDIIVYNSYQPFNVKSNQILIAEGVDSIIQVKVILSTKEINRIIKSVQRAKKIIREASDRDEVSNTMIGDVENFVNRIPYICIAFESELTLETTIRTLGEKYKDIPQTEQVDAIFVLNKFSIYNFRDGEGKAFLLNGKQLKGFVGGITDEKTIYYFIEYLVSCTPYFFRRTNPLVHYLKNEHHYDKFIVNTVLNQDAITNIKSKEKSG